MSEGETATGYLLLRVSLFLSLELLCVVKEVCPSELVGRVARALHGGQEATAARVQIKKPMFAPFTNKFETELLKNDDVCECCRL